MGTRKSIENLDQSLQQLKQIMKELDIENSDQTLDMSEDDLKKLSEKVINLAESLENYFKSRSR